MRRKQQKDREISLHLSGVTYGMDGGLIATYALDNQYLNASLLVKSSCDPMAFPRKVKVRGLAALERKEQ